MKLVKSLLLGSAAGLAVVAGAQAADLPVKKAAPIEYVRVCSAYGAGFFYIPGTETCLRVSGRARYEYQYSENFTRNANNGSISGNRGLARFAFDARTQTAYGTLRAFVRVDMASRTGAPGSGFLSGSPDRRADSFRGTGVDTVNGIQNYIELNRAFVQFGPITAGRVNSFFDFYAADVELIGSSLGSNNGSTNVFAYTAMLGNGFSATVSAEDPSYRRSPIFNVGGVGAGATVVSGFQSITQSTATAPIVGANGLAFVDVQQKFRMPDIVGQVRYDAPWGSAQVSAAVHELAVGQFQNGTLTSAAGIVNVNGTTGAGLVVGARRPSNEYAWAVQGGLKINAPFIAAGDVLWLQGAYSQGSLQYAGINNNSGFDAPTAATRGALTLNAVDAVVNPFGGRMALTEAFTVAAAYLHYWSPEWRSAAFGTYGEVYLPRGARAAYSLLGTGGFGLPTGLAAVNSGASLNAFANNATLRDFNILYAGANLIWSPVRDLDIGVEGVYQRIALNQGRATDANNVFNPVVNGIPTRTRNSDDQFLFRFRVQRDF